MTNHQGKFVWYELMTSDTAAAETFYKSVIGWTAQQVGAPDKPYVAFSANGNGIGGMLTIPEEARANGARPNWAGYIWVSDIDAKIEELKAAGGTLHRAPEDIPTIGRFAVVADPHGAHFVLFKHSGDRDGPVIPRGTLGHVGWHELHAGDQEQALAFYAKIFGWTKASSFDMGPMGVYQLFATGDDLGNVREDQAVGGMMTKMAAFPVSMWVYYFNVTDIDVASARVVEGGGKVLNGPMKVPGGNWVLQALDPQGAMFAMVADHR